MSEVNAYLFANIQLCKIDGMECCKIIAHANSVCTNENPENIYQVPSAFPQACLSAGVGECFAVKN